MARNPLTPFRSGGLVGGDPFVSLHREMNRLFDDVLHGTSLAPGGGQGGDAIVLAPQLNVSETDNEIRVTAELPGVSQDDVHVELDDDVLVIRGEKKLERKDAKENFHFVERSYGTFQRALHLPFPVDQGQVKANFENGVLTVTLPKTAQQQRSRRIQVQGGISQAGGQSPGQGAGATGQTGSQDGQSGQAASGQSGNQGGQSGSSKSGG